MPPVPAPGTAVAEGQPGEDPDAPPPREPTAGGVLAGIRRRPLAVGGAALVVLFAPLLVALVALRRTEWFPILDLAMTELRVRDVGSRHTPLIGLPGRIGVIGEQGSHPGPISFWALAGPYRLLGSAAWSLQAAAVTLHAAAMATALWIAHRRGGVRLVLGIGVVLAMLTRAYGTGTMTEPWNPYMPVLWWFVLLLAVWSVLDDDLAMLPLAAFAATFCLQTHTPYVGVVAGASLLAVVAVAARSWARRRDPAWRARALRWTLAAAGVVVALWAAPVAEELTRDPGNLTKLVDHFASPTEETAGLRRGAELVLLHLDPWRLLTEQQVATGSLVEASQSPAGSLAPGLVVVLAWLAAVAGAWRLRHGLLLRLHLVLGVALVFAAVAISRIFGQLWYYLMIWAWGITALVLFATLWTAAAALHRRVRATPREVSLVRAGVAGLVVAGAVSAAVFTVDAAGAEPPAIGLSDTLGVLVGPTVAALRGGEGPAPGPDGRYLVTWSDALYIGSQGIGLVNELVRRGFDVGVAHGWRIPAGPHRFRTADEADAVVHLATGLHVERWRAKEGVVEVAYHDPRSPAERREYDQLRARVLADLRELGLTDRLVDVDENLFAAAIDTRVPRATQDRMSRMLDLGSPAAVFLGPPDAGY